MAPVTETLTYGCDNFANCGTPAVTGTGLPAGWSDNTINGARVILCQVCTPLESALPAAPAIAQAATLAQVKLG
jgi:hypothetical protein